MNTDYEIMQHAADSVEEVIAKAGRLLMQGKKLSEQLLSSADSKQTYEGFLVLVQQTSNITRKHHFGHYEKIEQLGIFEQHTWAELLAKARVRLGFAKEFQLRLQSTQTRENEEEGPGFDDVEDNWGSDFD
jgi:hypothetical protein